MSESCVVGELTWGDVAVRWRGADVRSSGDDGHANRAGTQAWEGQHGGQRSLGLHEQNEFSVAKLSDLSPDVLLHSPEGSAVSS